MPWFSSKAICTMMRASENTISPEKMHEFHVFPKTEYLMRSVALFFVVVKIRQEVMRTKTFFLQPNGVCYEYTEF